ncbi:hypothetical protein OVS_03550 [Mycoplasma ovis str. Michigan]|uniref:Uncharacterized protein n=1 Tax=Mycoplasma ovis str. Michigan TaxID=1415773 RepID=A0ABN4BRD9_9MOLU|nr:hypothetical protein OVS_03550 [Mycoplasma ovis str. Michigan]
MKFLKIMNIMGVVIGMSGLATTTTFPSWQGRRLTRVRKVSKH